MSVVNISEHSDNTALQNQFALKNAPLPPAIEAGSRAFPPFGRISLDPSTRLLPGRAESGSLASTAASTAANRTNTSAPVTQSVPTASSGEDSTVLMGGSPLRLMKLTGSSKTVMHLLARGATVAEAAASAKISIRSVARLADRLLDAQLAHPVWNAAKADPPLDTKNAKTIGDHPPQIPSVAQGHAEELSTVTLVIPVKDRSVQLRRLLESVHQEMGEGLRVLVVDDGSTDNSGNVARDFGAQVIRNEQSLGPAAARNQGLVDVATPFVAFVDSDCTCTYGWLAVLLQHFNDPSVALVAPRIFGHVHAADVHTADIHPIESTSSKVTTTQPTAHADRGVLDAYEHVRSPLDLGPEQALIVPRTRVSYVPSAALLARTEVLRTLNGFASSLHVGEDVDLLWRLHAAGWRSRYEPRGTVAHDHRVTWRAFTQRRYQYGTSAAVLDARHPGQVAPLAVSGWSALGWLGLCTLTPTGVLGGLGTMAFTTALLPPKLGVLANPRRMAVELAGRGHLGAGRQLASATWRAYLPIALVSLLAPKPFTFVARFARRILLASALVPNIADWRLKHPKLDPFRYVGIRLLDDAAYCTGVWMGALRARSLSSLKPDFTSWPGKNRNDTAQAP
jgi:mycofactocin glycosyltransferase